MSPTSASTHLNRARMLQFSLGLALLAVTLVLYWPVRTFDFITAYDDQKYVTENPMVRGGLTLAGVRWAFSTGYASNWHPLTWISHMTDVQVWGLDAGAHHLINLCLHTANALLLFVLLRRYTGASWRSAFVAALFAWHPLHVESVAWIAERKDVLSTFFLMLTLWTYGEYVRKVRSSKSEVRSHSGNDPLSEPPAPIRARVYYALTLTAFALGLMTKPMLVTTPFLLLLLDYWPLRRLESRNWRQVVLEKVPFLVLAAASSMVTLVVQRAGGAVATLESLPFSERAANALVSYVRYLGKTVWPEPLAIPYPWRGEWPVSVVLGACVLLLAVSLGVWVWRRQYPFLLVGWFWFVGTLVPVIGLVQVGGQAMADRYTYVPLIGIFMSACWGVEELVRRFSGASGVKAARAVGVVALVLCMGGTRAQLSYWQNSVALFQHAVSVTRDNATAHVNLGKALFADGKLQEALGQYQAALTLRPTDAQALNDVGNLFLRAGKPAAAVEFYQRALALKPADASFHFNLGNAKSDLGQTAEAVAAYEAALKLDPRYARAHTGLALVLMRMGRLQEAWPHATRAAELEPQMRENHNLLGNLYAAGEKHEQAVASYREALRLDPRMTGVYLNLGSSLLRLGRTNEAVAALEQGVRLNPGLWQAHARLGEVYASIANFPKALECATQALQIAEKAGLKGVADELNQRLARYRTGEK